MNRARRKLLAATRWPDDKDPAVGWPHSLGGLSQLIGGRGMADDGRGRRAKLFELLDLALEPRVVQGPLGDQQEPISLERLFDEVIGTALNCRNRGLDVAVAGDHHHRQLGMVQSQNVEQLQSVEAAALQPDVKENEVGPAGNDCRDRLLTVACSAGAIALVLQNTGDQFADIDLVVDDQDIGCHDQTVALWTSTGVEGASTGSAVKRNCIHAPRAPATFSEASRSSMRPPCSSRMRPTIANPKPVPFSRVVT